MWPLNLWCRIPSAQIPEMDIGHFRRCVAFLDWYISSLVAWHCWIVFLFGWIVQPSSILSEVAYAGFQQLLQSRASFTILHGNIYIHVFEVRSPPTVAYALWWNNLGANCIRNGWQLNLLNKLSYSSSGSLLLLPWSPRWWSDSKLFWATLARRSKRIRFFAW